MIIKDIKVIIFLNDVFAYLKKKKSTHFSSKSDPIIQETLKKNPTIQAESHFGSFVLQ